MNRMGKEPGYQETCLKAQTLLGQNDIKTSLELLEESGFSCPQLGPLFLELIKKRSDNGGSEGELEKLQKLAQLGMLPPEGWQILGIELAIEKPGEASSVLRLGLELGLENPQLNLDLIRALQESEYTDDPSYVAGSVGQVLIRHQQWRAASRALENALEQDPEYAEVWALYGTVLDRLGQDGLAALETGRRLDPTNPIIHYLLGKHFLYKAEQLQAIQELRYAAFRLPANAAIQADLGAAYNLNGDTDAALAYYRRAAELEPDDRQLWLLLAEFSLEQGIEVDTTGIPAARKVLLSVAEQDPQALDSLGYGYYLIGNTILAKRFMIRALQADPRNAEARYHFGLLNASLGQIAEAKQEFGHAIELDPAGSIGDLARRALKFLDS
jgi:Flp pilus assembly protein TadD